MDSTLIDARAVFVTGGSGGLGRAMVDAFAAEGARVGWSTRSPSAGTPVGEVVVPLELSSSASIDAAVVQVSAELGGLDTLVVNAVRWPTAGAERFEDLDPVEWQAMLRANVEGAFTLVQAALPALRASGNGRIVLISSGVAEEGHPPMPAYAAAKASLHGFARALAWDAGRNGILVNTVAVGFTRTPTNSARFGDDLFARAGALTPQRRVSEPADVAGLVRWLGSSQNTSVTGEVIREGTSAARTPLVALS